MKRRATSWPRGTDWAFSPAAFREAAQRELDRERKTREAQARASATAGEKRSRQVPSTSDRK